ncbi:hypothetical protein [Bacillus sp. JJ1764]|uniref:hypothetical protein n=1 Tax=Bacillus sp. JJ1764 TaxID=3122964 RepID=UPI0030000F92
MQIKKVIIMLITFVLEAIITYFIALKFTVRFIEVMFFTGLAFAVLSFFFSTGGGKIADLHSSQLSGQTGIIQKREPFIFRRGQFLFLPQFFCL